MTNKQTNTRKKNYLSASYTCAKLDDDASLLPVSEWRSTAVSSVSPSQQQPPQMDSDEKLWQLQEDDSCWGISAKEMCCSPHLRRIWSSWRMLELTMLKETKTSTWRTWLRLIAWRKWVEMDRLFKISRNKTIYCLVMIFNCFLAYTAIG